MDFLKLPNENTSNKQPNNLDEVSDLIKALKNEHKKAQSYALMSIVGIIQSKLDNR